MYEGRGMPYECVFPWSCSLINLICYVILIVVCSVVRLPSWSLYINKIRVLSIVYSQLLRKVKFVHYKFTFYTLEKPKQAVSQVCLSSICRYRSRSLRVHSLRLNLFNLIYTCARTTIDYLELSYLFGKNNGDR